MFTRSRRRSGFTLPEVLVTVAIVAILAAVVVPAVTQQIGKGDQGQFTGNVQSLQTGVTTYVSDVRRYPRFLSQFTTQVAAGDSTSVPYGVLSAAEAARWKGPYIQAEITAASGMLLGYGLTASDTLRIVPPYITLRVTGDSGQVDRVDSELDGSTGAAAGNLRWLAGNNRGDSAYYLLTVAR